jgi:hypothetical protein
MSPPRLVTFQFLSCATRIGKGGLLFLMAVLVTGCSHDFVLRKPDGSIIGPGTLDFSKGNSAGAVELEIIGTTYRGSWESHKVDESLSMIAKYGINSRKYWAYSLGNGNYLMEGRATLHSDQGEVLKCEFLYRGVNGQGSCESGSEKFDIVFTAPGQTESLTKAVKFAP